MSQIIDILCWWGVLGIFIFLFPKPKSRKNAFLQLLVAGPIGWVLFIPISIDVLLRKNKQKDLK